MTRTQTLAVIILVIMVGFALRLYQLDRVSFRGDEAFTVLNWVRQPLAETLSGSVPTSDPQPPLAYALFRGWSLVFGESEFSLRVLPALANIIGIAAVFALGYRIGGRMIGVIAAVLWALHPFLIWHAQDARNYAIWSACSVTAVWLALRAIEKHRQIDWILYVIVAAMAAYLYYLELFILVALNLYVAYWIFIAKRSNRTLIIQWVAAQIAIGLILVPWFLQPRLLSGGGYGGTTGRFDAPLLLTWFLPSLVFGRTLPDELTQVIWPLLLIFVALGIVLLWRARRNYVMLLVFLIVIPVALLAVVSTRLNVFTPRYVLAIVPALLLLLAVVVLKVWRWNHVLTIGLVIVFLSIDGMSLANFYYNHDYAKSNNWRELAGYLHQHMQSDDLVIPSSSDIAFTLYYDNFSDIKYLPANPLQPEEEIRQVLDDSRNDYHSFWVVGRTPPDWQNISTRDSWLSENMQLVRTTNIDDLPINQYLTWEVQPAEIKETPLTAFDDLVELSGVSILSPEPDNKLFIWLYWHPLKVADTSYKIFVHLVADSPSGSTVLAQDDQYPQDARITTTNWSAAEVYRDVYQLSLDGIPAGQYTLITGLYDPTSGDRVLLDNGQDYYMLGLIEVP
ncbi:MAG: glycosyltransferase family 39 protein [Anaerolineae bacterium]|nr:glycosyltransferase family 39 protein [Anaerolineae bacterium]